MAIRRSAYKRVVAFSGATPYYLNGAGARNRTETTVRSGDFESPASTSFTTPAMRTHYIVGPEIVKKIILTTKEIA